jgi:hypothetical protein
MVPSPVEGDGAVPEQEKVEEPRPEFDFSKMKPEDFVCFGTIEPGHPECEACPFKEACAAKAGLSLT